MCQHILHARGIPATTTRAYRLPFVEALGNLTQRCPTGPLSEDVAHPAGRLVVNSGPVSGALVRVVYTDDWKEGML